MMRKIEVEETIRISIHIPPLPHPHYPAGDEVDASSTCHTPVVY